MATEVCSMFIGSGLYLNTIIIALIFSFIFWGMYYLIGKHSKGKK